MTAAIGHPTLRLLRVRIGNFRLAPLPPGQWRVLTPEDIKLVAGQEDRIAAVIGCTAFDAGEGHPPFVIEFDIGVAELEKGESAAAALERAAARLQAKAS